MPTNETRAVTMSGVTIARIPDGKVVERWAHPDRLGCSSAWAWAARTIRPTGVGTASTLNRR